MEQSALRYLLHGEDLSLEQIAADLDRIGLHVKSYPAEFSQPDLRTEQIPAPLSVTGYTVNLLASELKRYKKE